MAGIQQGLGGGSGMFRRKPIEVEVEVDAEGA